VSAEPPALLHGAVVERLRTWLRQRSRRALALSGARSAAVAVLLLDRGGAPCIPLTLRSPRLRAHSGQVSFPGGVCDPGDASAAATALRESHEEIGIPPGDVRVLGLMDDQATPTGYVITPVVCELLQAPRYVPNPDEVTAVFEAPLASVCDPACGATVGEERVGDLIYPVRVLRVDGHRITGATARILDALAAAVLAP
jgi:8-oxo-dGTP pyrophosphatase MutT (NUDIX family)